MKPIVLYTKQEYAEMKEKHSDLLDKLAGYTYGELMAFHKSHGYAHSTFNGKYTDSLIEALGSDPMPDEIIMLIDGGFSHFGAECTVDIKNKTFRGRVNID